MSESGKNITDYSSFPREHVESEGEAETVEASKSTAKSKNKSSHIAKSETKRKATNAPTEKAAGKRKKKATIWDHYESEDDVNFARCTYCKAKISCSSKNGTNALKNHITRCKKFPANLDMKQRILDLETKTIVSKDGTGQVVSIPKCWVFDQEATRRALARMIIVDELPFSFVEREGFRYFCKVGLPQFALPSRATATRDCYKLFIEERRKLREFFKTMSSRVCLTTDTWTSGQNLTYMCLTAHFVDDDWKLHKRIINFCPIAGHSGELIGRAVEKCLLEWNLKRILTLTVDNASSNDQALQYLKRRINHWGDLVEKGDYLHMRCAAHILNLVVKEGLKDLDESIMKIRGAVKYVRSSPARLQKFKSCVEEEKIDSKSLVCLDVETRWNSTYLMLRSALVFKKAFQNLHSKDHQWIKEQNKFGGTPSEQDWCDVASFLPFLKIFYDATLRLSGSRYVTGNFYVLEIYGIRHLISSYLNNNNEGIRRMAGQMKTKSDKYWANVDNINVLLFIALVLDPRYKMHFVKWLVKTSYDETRAKLLTVKITLILSNLFGSYSSSLPKTKSTEQGSSSGSSSCFSYNQTGTMGFENDETVDVGEFMNMMYNMEHGSLESQEEKSELDKYLSDPREPLNDPSFEILQWWKDQKKRYPVLRMIAKDVLAIPVSTVASESAFSTGGRVLDFFRTSLTPRMVEALICGQDWLRSTHAPLFIEESFLELENIEKGMKDLTLEQPTILIDETISALDENF